MFYHLIQIIISAIANVGAGEDCNRIGPGGVARRQAIDVTLLRRVAGGGASKGRLLHFFVLRVGSERGGRHGIPAWS